MLKHSSLRFPYPLRIIFSLGLLAVSMGCTPTIVPATLATLSNPVIFYEFTPVPADGSGTAYAHGNSHSTVANLFFYSDAVCTQLLGSGSKSTFEGGSGIAITVSTVTSTLVYAKWNYTSGTISNCTYLATYL